MHKKLLVFYIGFSVLCNADQAEFQEKSRWQRVCEFVSSKSDTLLMVTCAGLSACLSFVTMNKAWDYKTRFDGDMFVANRLNSWWVSFLKENPGLDFAPIVQNQMDQ